MKKKFDNIGGTVSEGEWDPDRTNKISGERKSSCHQSLLIIWTETQSRVKISSFLLLIQEKPGGSETQITVIKKNTWQRHVEATCQGAIVSNLENCKKTRGPTILWPEANDKWLLMVGLKVSWAGKIHYDFLMIGFWNHLWLMPFCTVSIQITVASPSALNANVADIVTVNLWFNLWFNLWVIVTGSFPPFNVFSFCYPMLLEPAFNWLWGGNKAFWITPGACSVVVPQTCRSHSRWTRVNLPLA